MKTTEELKNLLYKNETVADAAPDAIAAAQDFCEGYKTFLDNAKTEREATAYSEKLLTAAGYQKFVPGTSYAPGTKVYTINREKCVLAATIGTKNLEEGFHLNIATSTRRASTCAPCPCLKRPASATCALTTTAACASTSGPPSLACTVSSTAPTAPGSTSASVRRTTTPCSASPTCCRIWVPSRAPRRWPRHYRRGPQRHHCVPAHRG